MTSLDYKQIEDWCQQAVVLLEEAGLSPNLANMTREAIKRHSGSRALHEIAADLAEGLHDLPSGARETANNMLIERHGFGYNLYIDAKLKRVRAVLVRGKIKSDDEYRELLDVVSDTTIDKRLLEAINILLAKFEASRKEG